MISLRSKDEIEKLKIANRVVREVLDALEEAARPGVTTLELDLLAERMALEQGAVPSFKGFRGFPRSLCTSINEEVVHGIPSERALKAGDLLKIDFGVNYQGFYGDSARSVYIGGEPPQEIAKLMSATREALHQGIAQARNRHTVSDISCAVQKYVESQGFSVVRDFVGHGIGRAPHEEPPVPNYDTGRRGPVLQPGMVLAIEPMVNRGRFEVDVLGDGWTVVTRDRSLSAHFEHSIAITDAEPIVLSA